MFILQNDAVTTCSNRLTFIILTISSSVSYWLKHLLRHKMCIGDKKPVGISIIWHSLNIPISSIHLDITNFIAAWTYAYWTNLSSRQMLDSPTRVVLLTETSGLEATVSPFVGKRVITFNLNITYISRCNL